MNDARKPPTKDPVQARIKINLNEMPVVGCPNCGCQIFTTDHAMFRKLSAIQVGKPMLARIPLELCQGCGALHQVVGDEMKLVEMVPVKEEDDAA